MPNVKITRNGETIEILELSFEQVKELAGLNGHAQSRKTGAHEQADFVVGKNGDSPRYSEFKKALSKNSYEFLRILRDNPTGIAADALAESLGLKETSQMGGLVGGGIGKIAPRFNVELRKLYKKEVRFDKGERRVIYKPGIDIAQVVQ
jgi:hypothetical protein